MKEYRGLQEICATLYEVLQRQTATLFSANADETPEEVIENKLKSLSILGSKNRLLHASREAVTPQIEERVLSNVNVVDDLENHIQARIIDNTVIKSIQQTIAVKNLLTTEDKKLEFELVEWKTKIKELSGGILAAETHLRDLNKLLEESEREHANVMKEWDKALGDLKHNTAKATPNTVCTVDPKYIQIKEIVLKTEIIQRIISQLFTSRTHYNWSEDPKLIFDILELTRTQVTVEKFLE